MSTCPQKTLDLIESMTEALQRITETGDSVTFDGVSYSNHNLTTLQSVRAELLAECSASNSGSRGRKSYGQVVFGSGR